MFQYNRCLLFVRSLGPPVELCMRLWSHHLWVCIARPICIQLFFVCQVSAPGPMFCVPSMIRFHCQRLSSNDVFLLNQAPLSSWLVHCGIESSMLIQLLLL